MSKDSDKKPADDVLPAYERPEMPWERNASVSRSGTAHGFGVHGDHGDVSGDWAGGWTVNGTPSRGASSQARHWG